MTAIANLTRRFLAATHGIAAVEFAMIVPVLLLLFLASFDAGRAIAAYMKVKAATFTVAPMSLWRPRRLCGTEGDRVTHLVYRVRRPAN